MDREPGPEGPNSHRLRRVNAAVTGPTGIPRPASMSMQQLRQWLPQRFAARKQCQEGGQKSAGFVTPAPMIKIVSISSKLTMQLLAPVRSDVVLTMMNQYNLFVGSSNFLHIKSLVLLASKIPTRFLLPSGWIRYVYFFSQSTSIAMPYFAFAIGGG